MSETAAFESAFLAARRLQEQGRHADAEQAYRRLASDARHRESVLSALADLYLQASQPQQAAETLAALTDEFPDNPRHYWELASLLLASGRPDAGIEQYRRLLDRHPEYAAGYFNLALLYRRALRYRDARTAYEKALDLGIDNAPEVYSNLGVLYTEMRDAGRAREMYVRALAIDGEHLPAIYNLAMLCEEEGDAQRAGHLYERIVAVDPGHADAVARLAYLEKCSALDDPRIARLRQAIAHADDKPLQRECLYFALGKMLDELGHYDAACDAYRAGNAIGCNRSAPYDREIVRQGFDRLIEHISADWIARHVTISDARPIFVCGMYRSGSTLIEQMLGGHPAVTAGGELDFLPHLIARELTPYPQRVDDISSVDLQRFGAEYLAWVGELFASAQNVTDKRPDNFLHLGLLKAMFPRLRVVYTKRNRLDNCISVYFQQLGGGLGYAANAGDTAHYYGQHERLMRHWQECLGDDIFTVDYDELVRRPEPVLRDLLEFLGLDWCADCLSFERPGSLVRTASLWQVRQGLHTASSGRWRNYPGLVSELELSFGDSSDVSRS